METYKVQFYTKSYNSSKARRWLRNNNYNPIKRGYVEGDTISYMIRPLKHFAAETFTSVPIGNEKINIIIGKPSEKIEDNKKVTKDKETLSEIVEKNI